MSSPSLIHNNTNWIDTDGNPILAHAGGMTRVADTYYWYGMSMQSNQEGMFNERVYLPKEDPNTWRRYFDGFTVYSSTDLVNWTYEGLAFPPPQQGFGTLYISARPHVIYNDNTRKFVMYFYYYPIYPGCLLMVATSDTPIGPFELVGPVEAGSFCGHVGDMNVFKDEQTGHAYVLYDDTGFDIRIDRLSHDYCSSFKDGSLVMHKMQEAPAMVYFRGKYLVAGSGVQEFDPTEISMVYANHPIGPYSKKQIISQFNTWNSQITDMIYIPEADYVLVMCDQWFHPDESNINRSRYLWLPLDFDAESGQIRFDYKETWNPMSPFE